MGSRRMLITTLLLAAMVQSSPAATVATTRVAFTKCLRDDMKKALEAKEIGRAHVLTPVTNAHLLCRLLLEKKNQRHIYQFQSDISYCTYDHTHTYTTPL